MKVEAAKRLVAALGIEKGWTHDPAEWKEGSGMKIAGRWFFWREGTDELEALE